MNAWTIDQGIDLDSEKKKEMSSSSKRQLPNVSLEPTEKIRHLNTALIVSESIRARKFDK
jgi:hypothetical protein